MQIARPSLVEAFAPLMVTLPFTTWIQTRLQRRSHAPTAHLSATPDDQFHILMHFQRTISRIRREHQLFALHGIEATLFITRRDAISSGMIRI